MATRRIGFMIWRLPLPRSWLVRFIRWRISRADMTQSVGVIETPFGKFNRVISDFTRATDSRHRPRHTERQ
jgi:hypothetical protein